MNANLTSRNLILTVFSQMRSLISRW